MSVSDNYMVCSHNFCTVHHLLQVQSVLFVMPSGVIHMKKACSAIMWCRQLGKIWSAFGQHKNEYTVTKKNKYM